jgi:SAM-dependent methyltransferase
VGGRLHGVLDYASSDSGWSDELTRFHEDVAGAGTHPIDVASRRRARAALKRYVRSEPDKTVLLEAGSSSGFLLQELTQDWPDSLIIGSDYIGGPLRRLAERLPTLPLLRFDLVECPLPSASIDAALLLNVLEHIERHDRAVQQIARVLKPGGIAVVEVPAGPDLFDPYDKFLRHFRRYRAREVVGLLQAAGLQVIERSHLGFFVYPAFAIVKRRNRRWLDAPEPTQRQIVEREIRKSGDGPLLKWAMDIEESLARFIRYPIGIRCCVVARKPQRIR